MAFRKRIPLMAALLIGTVSAIPFPAAAFDDAEKQEIGEIVRDYLLANPEIFEEVQQALALKKEAESRNIAQAAITGNTDAIFNAAEDISLGNPNGDVTVVEFFDYNCGFCKRAMQDMVTIIEQDDNVRFVLKEFPILGPDSVAAHRVSMAFRKIAPEQYEAFHLKLLGGDVRATEAQAIDVAAGLGVDEATLRAGMDDPEIEQSIRQSYQLADALGISGTPSFILGDEAVFGAVGAEPLLDKIANLRSCKSTVC